MRYLLLAIVLSTALPTAMPVVAEPLVSEVYEFYPVAPPSVAGLLDEVNAHSPIVEEGHVYHGRTATDIHWRFWWQHDAGVCEINRVEVSVLVTFTLPRLEQASAEVADVWNAWYPQLLAHEEHHRDIGLATAQRIEDGLMGLQAAGCQGLAADANTWANEQIEQMQIDNRDYDDETRHGETEGARLGDYLYSEGR